MQGIARIRLSQGARQRGLKHPTLRFLQWLRDSERAAQRPHQLDEDDNRTDPKWVNGCQTIGAAPGPQKKLGIRRRHEDSVSTPGGVRRTMAVLSSSSLS